MKGMFNMKKEKKIALNNNNEKENRLVEKIIDLFSWYQIEESNNIIKMLGNEVKFYEEEKKLILDNCIFAFQRKKAYKEIDEIDEKIFKLYEKIGEEVTMIDKIKNSMDGNVNFDKVNVNNTDKFLSYYDLLSFLKRGIIFKKVSLNEFGKEVFYIYDYEGNYIIEDKTKVGDQFTTYLGEFDSDNNKFKSNIKIIEK